LNSFVEGDDNKKMYVYKGKSKAEQLATVETTKKITNNIQIYHIHIFNIVSNEIEELEMHYNRVTQCYYIYCNKDKENETIIGTIKMNKIERKEFKVEISPMVDTMLLISLGAIVVRLDTIKEIDKNKKTNNLNICFLSIKIMLYSLFAIILLIILLFIVMHIFSKTQYW